MEPLPWIGPLTQFDLEYMIALAIEVYFARAMLRAKTFTSINDSGAVAIFFIVGYFVYNYFGGWQLYVHLEFVSTSYNLLMVLTRWAVCWLFILMMLTGAASVIICPFLYLRNSFRKNA